MPLIRYLLLFPLLFATISLRAIPVITDVSPAFGTVAGGDTVIIRGSGFADPSPVHTSRLLFGQVAAESFRVIDSSTIEAVTPPHLPGLTSVSFCISTGCGTLRDVFTFTGLPEKGFEVLLLPVFGEVAGAHGSLFRTDLRGWNSGQALLPVYGLRFEPMVIILLPPFDPLEEPYQIAAGILLWPGQVSPVGRLLYVPKAAMRHLTLNLRAYDVSRSTTNFGTEVPIPSTNDFRTDRIILLGVPLDPLFRKTLRIYSLRQEASVRITIGTESRFVTLQPGRNIFEPAYAEIGDFPSGTASMEVKIEPLSPLTNPTWGGAEPPIWAFISVTNNETQHVTTITPQP
jgi:hypothetical protein